MSTIGVLGAGTWGTALACLLGNKGEDVVVWSALPEEIERLNADRRHWALPKADIPDTVRFTAELSEASVGCDLVTIVVPSPFVRPTTASLFPYITKDHVIAVATKGIEADTLFTMTEVVADELARCVEKTGANTPEPRLVALSGPTHAEEVSLGLPTTIVAASHDEDAARLVQRIVSCESMRAYTQHDVLGVEMCAALKNIIALACGIARGAGYGDNACAALITRGTEEIRRLGVARGCDSRTFFGLAGIGDVVVTATSMHSRNNRAGELIGKGMTADEAVAEVGMVVEGLNALPAAVKMSQQYGIEMPVVFAVDAVVSGKATVQEMAAALMGRALKAE